MIYFFLQNQLFMLSLILLTVNLFFSMQLTDLKSLFLSTFISAFFLHKFLTAFHLAIFKTKLLPRILYYFKNK